MVSRRPKNYIEFLSVSRMQASFPEQLPDSFVAMSLAKGFDANVQTPILVPRGCINFPVKNPAAGRPAASVCSSFNGVVCR
jgi:hypothetical protein